MISAAILFLHIIFLSIVFYLFYKKESLSSAFLNMIFILIIFSVGWTFWAFIVNLTVPPINSKEFNNDTITLLLLTFSEVLFYKFYYGGTIARGKGKQ